MSDSATVIDSGAGAGASAGDDSSDDDDDPESTSDLSRRWVFTNDLLAGFLLLSLPLLTAAGATQLLALGTIPGSWGASYLVIVGTAAVWCFGSDALEAYRS